jgi:single-strand DNA-binding protein
MRDLNKVEVMGTISKPVRTASSKSGLPIANIPIATVQKRQTGNDITTYHTIVCFGELADMASTFNVGDRVFATGSIQNESYEKDGQRQTMTKVKATHLAQLASEATDGPPKAQQEAEGAWGAAPPF